MDQSQRSNPNADEPKSDQSLDLFSKLGDFSCIDLPGEQVKCWRSSDQLTIILRKHRDVIFDLRLEKGASYTVESSSSPIYCDQKKQLILAGKRSPSFMDGERFHIWLSREFTGKLLVRKNGNFLMSLEPVSLDATKYDADPKTKPEPIIVSLGADSRGSRSNGDAMQKPIIDYPLSEQIADEFPVICVIDRLIGDAPAVILKYFSTGGGTSGLVDFDPFDVATRNWIFGQIAGSGAYAADNREWLKASFERRTRTGFRLVSAKLHKVRGKFRIYFSGYTRQNAVFGAGGFSPSNSRVMPIFSGAGSTSSVFRASAAGIAGAFKNMALVSFIFGSATAIAEWKADVSKDGYDLAAALILTLMKTVLIALVTTILVAIVACVWMVVVGAGLAVIAVGGLSIGVGLLVGYTVDAAEKELGKAITGDKNNGDGLAPLVAKFIRQTHQQVSDSWSELMRKFPNDYRELNFGRPRQD